MWSARPLSDCTLVMAAVNVVLPWSTCPIVPTFTWGFVRSNFAFAMTLSFHFVDDFFGLALRYFLVVAELHRVHRASLRLRAQTSGDAEHIEQRNRRLYYQWYT